MTMARGNQTEPARLPVVLVGLAAAVTLALAALGAFARPDLALHDGYIRAADARREGPMPGRVVLAEVSAARAESWQRDLPGGRLDLAALIERLAAGRPLVLVVDVPIDVASADDAVLAAAVARAGNVVLRAQLASPRPTEYAMTLLPRPLARAAAGVGFALWPADVDGVVRRMAMELPQVEARALAEAVAVASGVAVPNRGQRQLLLSWAGPPGRGFVSKPAEEWAAAELAHRVVVVGVTDVTRGGYTTPLARCLRADWVDRRPAYMSSPELLANGIETVLAGWPTRETGPLGLSALLLLAAGVGWLASRLRRPALGALAVVIGLGLYHLVAGLLHATGTVWLPVVAPGVAAVLSATAGVALRIVRHAADLRAEAEAAERERQRLVDLDQAKRAVLATIVHDLRNPVTVIKGQALTLLADPDMRLGARVHDEFLRGISVQCDRLAHTVEDLLDIDPDRPINLLVSPVPVRAVVERVAESYSLQSRRHTLRLELEELGDVLLDENRFERILANLVSNAIKYSPRGGAITVGLRGVPEQGEYCLSVRDEGIGMRPEQVSRLFGLFVRVLDDPRAIPGAGVGLHSVQRLVSAHGGRIEVSSEPEQGTEFRCWLPWRTVDDDAAGPLDRPQIDG